MDEFFARNRLSAYIDGELSDAEMAEVARAIEEQPELREAYDQLLAAVELVRGHGVVEAPEGFHRAVMQRVEGLRGGQRWWARLLGPLGRNPVQGLGVVVVAAAVLLLVFRGPVLDGVEHAGSDPAEAPHHEHEAAAPGPELEDEPPQGEAGGAERQAPKTTEAEAAVGTAEPPPEPAPTKEQIVSKLGTRGSAKATSAGEGVPIEELLKKEEGTYIPDWDKEASAPTATLQEPEQAATKGSGSLAVSPFEYRLTPHEPDALRKLVALAEKLGGGLYSTSGEPMDPYMLTTERNYARVVLHIPASRLESVEPYLRTMGGVVQVRAEDRLYAADAVQVSVEVQYQP